jgi:hypothetical protein
VFQQVEERLTFVRLEFLPERHGVENPLSLVWGKILKAADSLGDPLAPLGRKTLPPVVKLPHSGPLFGGQLTEKLSTPAQLLFPLVWQCVKLFLPLSETLLLFGAELLKTAVSLLKPAAFLRRDLLRFRRLPVSRTGSGRVGRPLGKSRRPVDQAYNQPGNQPRPKPFSSNTHGH